MRRVARNVFTKATPEPGDDPVWRNEKTSMKAWRNPGVWEVNPVNFYEEVTQDYQLPDRVFIVDSTLRKITETPGCDWTLEGAVDIAAIADEVGVQYMVINLVHRWQPPSRKILRMFEAVASLRRRFKLFGTSWLTKESIDATIDSGADGVDLTRGDPANFEELFDYARGRGVEVAKSTAGGRIEHVPPSERARQINLISNKDLAYVGIHENKGPTTPDAWRYYVKRVREALDRPVKLVPHIHNMLGQATAATCAAVMGGALGVDVAMNGIGTEGGLASLEEVAVSLEVLYGVNTGLRLERLRDYSRVVRSVTGIQMAPNKPLVGDFTFVMESDLLVKEVLQARYYGREFLHLLVPSLVGQQYTVVWGPNTIDETSATEQKLRELGLPHDVGAARELCGRIREILESQVKPYLDEHEVEALALELFLKGGGSSNLDYSER